MPLRTLHITTVDLTAYCFLRSWFRHLRSLGQEVALACTLERFGPDLQEVTDRIFPVSIPRRIRPAQDARALWELVQVCRMYRPHIVHTHTSKAGFLGRLAARLCGVPLVLHTIHELPQNAARSGLGRSAYRWLEQLAASWCDHLVTVSEVNAEQILRERICPPEKLTLVREGLELEQYRQRIPADEVRKEWDIPATATLFGMAARLESAKGHADLLAAFQLVLKQQPDAWLVLIGRGELRPQLEQLARQLEIDHRVRFAGWVEDLPSALAALDFFVLSSHYEGLGIVLLEALAMGRPVVSTRVGGTQDIVQDGVTGLFVPPHCPAELAEGMLKLIRDPEQARRLAAAGQARVSAEFRAEVADRRMEELYRRLWALRAEGRHHDRFDRM